MLVDVQTENGVFLAKVVKELDTKYKVRYLVYKKKGLYMYEDECEEVDKECICGTYDPEDTEEAAGFRKVEWGFALIEEDGDYEPSDSETETESDEESLVDEDESD
jgi:hypothetical protein